MTEIIRHCPDCSRSRLFTPHHDLAACCPDSGDQSCPEWLCVACGTTLLIGAIPVASGPSQAAITSRSDRVA